MKLLVGVWVFSVALLFVLQTNASPSEQRVETEKVTFGEPSSTCNLRVDSGYPLLFASEACREECRDFSSACWGTCAGNIQCMSGCNASYARCVSRCNKRSQTFPAAIVAITW